ncbi:MAG: hypoxanthine phosphoribosyltransferase [Bacteroidaceae bacterium]|nr:hypoxanthine phosphoribosyltransferase [Bacteroidaceae bacterium]
MIRIKDLDFEISIRHNEIEESIAAIAEKMNHDYEDKCPLLLAILNGSFIFAADLVRHLTFEHEIQFAKFSSYQGTESTGKVKELIGLNVDILDRDIIIVEDIIDTGKTMSTLLPKLKERGARSIEIATLLMKPEKLMVDLDVKYCAIEIPNDFIVGYGLDYDGLGRQYPDIYTVVDNKK